MAPRPEFDQPFEHLAPGAEPLDSRRAAEPCSCGLEPADAALHVYNEEAFRYFLDIERKRSEKSRRPFLLLLVDLRKRSLATLEMDRASAAALFSALATCLRETDFIGWYRAQSVIGAVLTQHSDSVSREVQEAVRRRVVEVLAAQMPAELAARVQIRLYRLPVQGPN